VSVSRLVAVFKVLKAVFKARNSIDFTYLTISESLFGNLKDLVIYLILFKNINRIVIHLHGGSFKTCVLDRSRVFRSLNKFFLARVRAAIISGPSHSVIFEGIMPNERLITIPNFAQDFMFCDPELVKCKFSGQSHLRIVYISGMTEGKGYMRLLRSYESLDPEVKARIIVDFAGKFESTVEKELFLLRIQGLPGVTYHGVVDDSTKAILHANSHVFCLPTSFMEGQPISILEAYASGCVVVTPPRPGILDIFHPDVNGYLISSEDSDVLKNVLILMSTWPPELSEIAQRNRGVAEKTYRVDVFCKRVEAVLSLN
jgi:glycosyltransferase involved in cell wall biosynthesis